VKSVTGEDGYPGTRGILNALSAKYCQWSGIVDIEPKPPILWTHGTADIVVSDNSAWDMGVLGQMEAIPGWPGEEVFPPQPMVTQIRTVLERYQAVGGRVQFEMIEGAGHGPHFDHAGMWNDLFFGFLAANS
jgi:pimeloyl-ACP methyl ester carboxylesterase